MDWFRTYNSIKDDPKILQFSPENRWFFVAILAISSEQEVRGSLPGISHIAIALRIRIPRAKAVVKAFVSAGLIDENVETKALTIHGWDKRQKRSDDTNIRQKDRRERLKEEPEVTRLSRDKTVPRVRATDTETDTEPPVVPLNGGRNDKVSGPPKTAPPGSAEHKWVLDAVPSEWGPEGFDTASNLLKEYPAAAVEAGRQKVMAKFGRQFKHGASGYWWTVCRSNPTGEADSTAPARPMPAPPKFHRASPEDAIPIPNRPESDDGESREGTWGARHAIPMMQPDRSDVHDETTPSRRSQRVS